MESSQLNVAIKVLMEMDIKDINVIGVSKGKERNLGKEEFHLKDRFPIALKYNDEVLFFIQRLRDEAHRFAIGAHRKKRLSSINYNGLDDIMGVGGRRKKALLGHFGSAKE